MVYERKKYDQEFMFRRAKEIEKFLKLRLLFVL